MKLSLFRTPSPAFHPDTRPVTLTVRRPNLSPAADEPLYFYDHDPYISLILAAFSIALPEGERFFIHSVRHIQPLITDPVLSAEVRAFIGQEAHHGNEHDRRVRATWARRGRPAPAHAGADERMEAELLTQKAVGDHGVHRALHGHHGRLCDAGGPPGD